MQIGALAATTGLTTKTIRFYEQIGLLPPPPRTAGGYRDYPEHAPARLKFIRDAQSAGLTLAELRSVLELRDGGTAPCGQVSALIEQHLRDLDRRMVELRATRAVLRDLADRAAVVDPGTCVQEDICTILKDVSLPSPGPRPARRAESARLPDPPV